MSKGKPIFDYVDRTSSIPAGAVYAAVNNTAVPVSFGAFGSTTYPANLFVEAAIDLTALLSAFDPCTELGIKTIFIKTKESQSNTATIVDFITPQQVSLVLGVADAGTDQTKCSTGSSTSFNISGSVTPAPGDALNTVTWSVVSGNVSFGNVNAPSTTAAVTGSSATIRFTVRTNFNCVVSDEVVLNVTPSPSISVASKSICSGSSTTLTASGSGTLTYSWNTGATTSTISVSPASTTTYTVTATNSSSCTSSATGTVTVNCTVPPTVDAPADVELECGASTATANTGTATGTVSCGTISITYEDAEIAANCTGRKGIDRTWKATDGCGFFTTEVQHIRFKDNTNPQITPPSDKQLQCGAATDTAHTGKATGTDNCSSVTISYTDAATPASCTGAAGIDRTWRAQDACGNFVTAVQHITFVDATKPQLTLPSDKQLECGAATDTAHTGKATATDNCDAAVIITYSDAAVAANCTGNAGIDRTWRATDGCGNYSTGVQHITFIDNTKPELTIPSDKELQCGGATDTAHTGKATATDNCNVAIAITYTDAAVAANCTGNQGIDRTWKAEDACGNSSTAVQHIRFVDTTNPELTLPSDKQLQCGAATDTAHTGKATATDNCNAAVTISYTDAPVTANCTGNAGIDRTWRATDGCGNFSTGVQHITFIDNTKPELTKPSDRQLECGAATDTSHTGKATATDNCNSPTITYIDSATDVNCTGNAGIDRTWRAEDACGNFVTAVQHITFVDNTAPEITCPADKDLQCGASTDTANTGKATATDNCNAAVTITYSDAVVAANCTGKAGIDRTWTAEDGCGNKKTCVQHIRFVDTTPPVITNCPADQVVECGSSILPSETGTAGGTDNCSNATPSYEDSQSNVGCATVITRTWTLTDGCNNKSEPCVQHIIIRDRTAPNLTCPQDIQLSCSQAPTTNVTGEGSATDGCASVDVFFTDAFTSGSTCQGALNINRTWTAIDGNGNIASCVQHITYVGTAPRMKSPDETGSSSGILMSAYPNPFSDKTIILFTVDHATDATMEVVSITGAAVATVFNGLVEAGQMYKAEFNAANNANGIYFYRLKTDDGYKVSKLILAR